MAAAIAFLAGKNGTLVTLPAGSGLGFYGTVFGASVQVAYYQDTTFITSANGTVNGGTTNNLKCDRTALGQDDVIWNGSVVPAMDILTKVPNLSGTLNVRFTYDDPVQTQQGKVWIYDRSTKTQGASGVTCYAAQIVNPSGAPGDMVGSGDANWVLASSGAGSGASVTLWNSPGVSGGMYNVPNQSGVQHDWYLGMSASPNSIGSKEAFGIYVELEYY
jgi:hypothetical protein